MNVVQLQSRKSGGEAAAKGGVVAALDVGSTKISCLIAEVTGPKEERALKVLGVGQQASRGVRCGAIINVDEAERAIRLAVDAAERMAGRAISEVHVNVSGGRPQSRLFSASHDTATGKVSPRDIDALTAAALAKVETGHRSILHVTPVQYRLDEAQGIKQPLGMHGTKLSLDLGVVMVEPAHMHNLSLAIERAHLSVAGFVAAPYAAAKSVLEEDEAELGVAVVDLGGATTSFAIFSEGALLCADVVLFGGQNITNDIARGLNTTLAHAERMKTLWGCAQASEADESELLSVPILGERGVDGVHKVPKSQLTAIIRPRLDEILEMLRDRMAATGMADFAQRGMVLTGGASQLTGLREAAAEMFSRPVRLAAPATLPGMPTAAHGPVFAVASGLLHYALKPDAHSSVKAASAGAPRQQGYMRKMGRWIVESL